MKDRQQYLLRRPRRTWMISGACALVTALLLFACIRAAHMQEARPRRADLSQPRTAPTPPASDAPLGDAPVFPVRKPSPTPTPETGVDLDPDAVIRFNADLVNLQVRVIDRGNRTVDDVKPDPSEFRVIEDGVPQKVEFVTKEEVPISYGLAVDASLSLRPQLDKVIEAGKTIVRSNKPGDETFLVRFVDSEKIETLQDFTSNRTALLESLDELYSEAGQTAVIDAVYLSAERVAEYKKSNEVEDRRRRALIVVTDGEDRASYYKQDQLFSRLREEGVQIYVIGLVGDLDKEDGGIIKKSTRERAMKLLNRLASETGGRVFYPNSTADLPSIANEIVHDMRTQYVVSYTPSNKARDGSFRTIHVSVVDAPGRDKRIALTRTGRIASPQGSAPKTPARKPAPAGSARQNPSND